MLTIVNNLHANNTKLNSNLALTSKCAFRPPTITINKDNPPCSTLHNAHGGTISTSFYMTSQPLLLTTAADNAIKIWIFDGPGWYGDRGTLYPYRLFKKGRWLETGKGYYNPTALK